MVAERRTAVGRCNKLRLATQTAGGDSRSHCFGIDNVYKLSVQM
jgi:hypothetical protein